MARRDPTRDQDMTKTTVVLLGAFVILALVLRIAFNMGVAFDADQQRYLYSGNDPWYHDNTIEHIVTEGSSLIHDPAINYPNGGANPNPPVYDWTTALDAWALGGSDSSSAVSLALNLNVAMWGALTVVPVFMVANLLWGRRAGLLAGFFMAVSAPHIQRSVFGFADHDAPTMFFITLAMAALLKAMSLLDEREYVKSWKGNPMPGLKAAVAHNQAALAWAGVAGAALAATALTWKGYPYVLAFMAVAFGLQLLMDHLKNKDSSALAMVYLVPVILSLLVALPYYTTLGFQAGTTNPHLYVLIGMLVATVVLVPTRELPSILVFPALLVAAAIGLVLILLVFPSIGYTIFSGLGYFNQSKLYTTIAEAQRTELGFVAANFGFFTFVLAFWPIVQAARKGFKGDARSMLMFAWSAVAVFMAFSAGRFIFNATPVFAVLAGAGTAWILHAAGLDEMGKRMRNLARNGNPVGAFFKGLTPKGATFTALVAVLLLAPNVWLGVDAAMSREYEADHGLSDSALGAFGVGFDVKSNGWLDLFDHLATLDQDQDLADRCAFMAWWDYGHWATAIGKHPTVADPFQNHYEQSGRFLASQSEEEATLWLALLLWNEDHDNAAAQQVWIDHGIDFNAIQGDLDAQYAAIEGLAFSQAFSLYDDMMDATGKCVSYFGVDERMYPISIGNTGIFYAPVYLANKNPDDFMAYVYSGTGLNLLVQQYDVDEHGDSFRLDTPRFIDGDGAEWVVIQNQAYRKGTEPTASSEATAQPIAVTPDLRLTQAFSDSMYARGFGHILTASGAPGDGLSHWRAIHQALRSDGQVRSTVLLEYFQGHQVSGTIVDGNGAPMANVDVTFTDGFGASHAVAPTDASGRFSVVAPFGDDLSLTVLSGGSAIYSKAWTALEDGGSTSGVTVDVPFATVTGRAYEDKDGDGAYDAGEEVSGVHLSVDGRSATTAADGTYAIGQVTGGAQSLAIDATGYTETSKAVTLNGGETTTADIVLTATPSEVTITFRDAGAGVAGVPLRITGTTATTLTTNADGVVTTSLAPGDYTVTVDTTFTDADGNEVHYDETRALHVAFGGADVALVIDAA